MGESLRTYIPAEEGDSIMDFTIMIDKNEYEAMYQTVMKEVMRRYPYSKVIYIDLTKEEYAEYAALSYCRKLQALREEGAKVQSEE